MDTTPRLSLKDWETALTKHFLMTAGDGSVAVRSFEVSGATLARAASISGASSEDVALNDFKGALRGDLPRLLTALEQGQYRRSEIDDTLGCFVYLALTILVDSQLEVDAGASAFRAKLASFLENEEELLTACRREFDVGRFAGLACEEGGTGQTVPPADPTER